MREIERLAKIGLPSVSNHVKKLEEEGFVKKGKKDIYQTFTANREDQRFKVYKRNDIVLRIYDSGLIDFLEKSFMPATVALFGSASRGEDVETSDIDLFLLAKRENIDLKGFEGKLKRKISLLFEEDLSELSKELLNNIINGVVLYGYLKVL
ncbi:MAG: nucleotidyltransferase domain-containing protein [Candidatus Aenigmatarchaeota archaeon]